MFLQWHNDVFGKSGVIMDDIKFINEDAIGLRILEAALSIIKEEGYENLKIRKVASVSGCSNSAIYTRFEDKDALCDAIAKMHAQPVYEIICKVYRPEMDVVTNLQRMAHAEMEIFYALDLDTCIQQMRYRGKDGDNPFVKKIEEVLRNASRKGEIKTESIMGSAYSIEASFWGFVCMTKANPKLNFEAVSSMLNKYILSICAALLVKSEATDIWDEVKKHGVNVDKALERLKGNKTTYKEFLIEFFEEPDFEALEDALSKKDTRRAFEYAHGLKGMAANLGLDSVYEPLSEMVEVLRVSSLDGANDLYEKVKIACKDISGIIYNE